MNEIWKPVPGSDGRYFVSNYGKIAGTRKREFCKELELDSMPDYYGLLSPYKDKDGYERTHLILNGKRKVVLVHRIVMLAFVGESDLQVNHKNEIKDDNRLENLEYMTCEENIRYSLEKPVERYDLKTGKTCAVYSSITAAGEDGYNLGNVSSTCSGRYSHHKGFGWRYA